MIDDVVSRLADIKLTTVLKRTQDTDNMLDLGKKLVTSE